MFKNDEIIYSAIEIESFIDSISIEDGYGKEITLKIKTMITNKDEFYTDSNGLEMQKRKLNHRATWNLDVNQPVAGNYYPITSMISINDTDTRLVY